MRWQNLTPQASPGLGRVIWAARESLGKTTGVWDSGTSNTIRTIGVWDWGTYTVRTLGTHIPSRLGSLDWETAGHEKVSGRVWKTVLGLLPIQIGCETLGVPHFVEELKTFLIFVMCLETEQKNFYVQRGHLKVKCTCLRNFFFGMYVLYLLSSFSFNA